MAIEYPKPLSKKTKYLGYSERIAESMMNESDPQGSKNVPIRGKLRFSESDLSNFFIGALSKNDDLFYSSAV